MINSEKWVWTITVKTAKAKNSKTYLIKKINKDIMNDYN